jgi:DNA-binding transcriptional ArsR family regulator
MRPEPLTAQGAESIARRFRVLADPTRLRILDLLCREGEASVGQVAERVGGSQQNVSKHLAALHGEALVARRRRGTQTLYRVVEPGSGEGDSTPA